MKFAEHNEHLMTSFGELNKMFTSFDKDGDGKLTPDELEAIVNAEFQHAGFARRSDAMVKIRARSLCKLAVWSKKRKGKHVEFVEFLGMLNTNPGLLRCHAGIRAIFNQHDTDGDGKLSKAELKEVLVHLPGWPDEGYPPEIDVMWERVDKNKDGLISFEEFAEFAKDELSQPQHEMLIPVTLSWMFVSLKEMVMIKDWNLLHNRNAKKYRVTGDCVTCNAPLIGGCKGSSTQYGFNYCSESCRSKHVGSTDWDLARKHAIAMSEGFSGVKRSTLKD